MIGDNIYAIFPNIYTLRGAEYRDPMDYVNAIDQMLLLEPEHMVPSHVKPVSGKDQIHDILISTRDATQFIYDQTIRGMNQGYTADELSYMIELPSWLEDHPWLTQSRGQIPWHVKQIYYGNLGWYQGDAAFLLPISDVERAEKIVSGFGGVDDSILQVRQAISDNEYDWAAELATYVLRVEYDNDEAKLLKAHALRVLGERMLFADGRHWALTSALELEGKIIMDPNSFSQTSPEQLSELPIEKILKSLSVRINPDDVDNDVYVLNVIYPNLDEEYTLHFRNGVLAILPGLSSSEDQTVTLDSSTHKAIISGDLEIRDAIDSEMIQFSDDIDELRQWFGYLDPLPSH